MASTEKIRVAAFCGSLRKASFNRMLLNVALEVAPPTLDIDVVDYRELPPYDEDLRPGGSFPPLVAKFRERLSRAQAFLFITPEYNYSIPGALKNAIDWASRPPDSPMVGKACAVGGASVGFYGTVRMQVAMRQVFVFLDMHPVNKPELMVTRAQEKFDSSGKLTDEQTRKIAGDLLVSLEKLARKLAG